jgi:hypothetical protein
MFRLPLRKDLWDPRIYPLGNNHEGSIPFTRSTEFRAFTKLCK